MAAERTPERLIILDRDGVINENRPDYVRTPDEWRPLKGSIEAMVSLYRHGYRLVIASNQSAIGRGLMSVNDLIRIHAKMQGILGESRAQADGLFFCPHAPNAKCECRKPRPGLLKSIAGRYRRSLDGVLFVGDSMRDVKAAYAAGALPVLVRTGLGSREERDAPSTVPVYNDLAAVVREELGLPCEVKT